MAKITLYTITNSVHRGDMKRFYEKFKLPGKLCFPVAALIIGYSDSDEHIARGRLDGPGIIHPNEYRRLDAAGLAANIDQYDKPGKNMGVAFYKPSQNYSRYMDWYFNSWSSPPDTEKKKRKNAELNGLLKEIGFIE